MKAPGRAGTALAALAAVGAVLATPLPAGAVEDAEPDAGTGSAARLVVTNMTGVLGPAATPADGPGSSDLELRLMIQNNLGEPLDDPEVAVEVFDAAGTRSTLRAALDEGTMSTPQVHRQTSEVAGGGTVAPGGVANVGLTVPGASAGWLGRGGVYPVRISLLDNGRALDRVVTGVVYLAAPPAGRLLTTVVWPVTAPPWRLGDGSYPLEADEQIRRGGRLRRILEALADHPGLPVLLAPATHLLEDVADRADGFVQRQNDRGRRQVSSSSPQAQRATTFIEDLRELARQTPLNPVASPYAEPELASLTEGPRVLRSMAGRAVAAGPRRLVDLAGREPQPSTILPRGPLTPRALDVLSGDHILLGYGDIQAPDLVEQPAADLPPAWRTLQAASGRMLTATVADPFITATLTNPDDRHGTAVAVQRTLVESAMKFFQAPEQRGRPLLILPPDEWDPPRGFASGLLDALDRAPWLELGRHRPDAAAERSAPRARLTDPGPGLPEELTRAVATTQRRLDALQEAIPGGAAIAGRAGTELNDQLLRAVSRWFLSASGEPGRQLQEGVATAIRREAGTLTVPAAATVTLTSRQGEVPVTIQRDGGAPLDVRVTVQSGAGLDWPEGRELDMTVQPGTSETVSFPVRAVSRGRVPVTVTVTDPSGELQLGRASLTVRSTTISTPALSLVGGVVVILLGVAVARRRGFSRHLEVVE